MKTVFRILKQRIQQLSCLALLLSGFVSTSQSNNNIDALLAAGINDAQHFATDYLAPGTNGLVYSLNSNWFNTAKVKPTGGFEISLVASGSTYKDDKKSFLLDTSEYENLQFKDGAVSKNVATILGQNNPEVIAEVTYDGLLGEETAEFTLPDGLGAAEVDVIPTAFLQVSVGLVKNTELKARFVPSIKTKDVAVGLYGAGLQHEFTKWLPADKVIPVAVSGLVAYTHLDASYDFTASSGIDGENQRIETDVDTWLFELIASTKLPIINFYGGIGYLSGKTNTDLLGEYRVETGVLSPDRTITDPFSVASETASLRGTLGTKLKLGFFRLNAEYSLAEYNSFSFGVNFGFR